LEKNNVHQMNLVQVVGVVIYTDFGLI